MTARNALRLIFAGQSAGPVEQSEGIPCHYFHSTNDATICYANDNVSSTRSELLVPNLQIVRFLNVRVKKLTGKSWLSLFERIRSRVAESHADILLQNFRARSIRQSIERKAV